MHFGKKGKLSPRYAGPFEILDKMGEVAYRLALPPNMSSVLNVFYDFMLRKYVADPNHVRCHKVLDIEPGATHEGATWELEYAMRDKYPHLF